MHVRSVRHTPRRTPLPRAGPWRSRSTDVAPTRCGQGAAGARDRSAARGGRARRARRRRPVAEHHTAWCGASCAKAQPAPLQDVPAATPPPPRAGPRSPGARGRAARHSHHTRHARGGAGRAQAGAGGLRGWHAADIRRTKEGDARAERALAVRGAAQTSECTRDAHQAPERACEASTRARERQRRSSVAGSPPPGAGGRSSPSVRRRAGLVCP